MTDKKGHLLDEQHDRNRAKRERHEECTHDVNCGVHVSMGACRREKALKQNQVSLLKP